ncbi:MAG TPA: heavy-metal-associated domain-containing protein [Gemmatimonadaceae bacterium]
MRTRLRILGMSTPHCIRAVFTALTPVEGILSADVVLGSVDVEHDGRATAEALREAIAVAGYEVVEAVEERRQLRVI